MKSIPRKIAVVIAGPTAVGKTGVAIRVANYFDTEIISADSRQCYKELNIGVARPSEEQLKQAPHHFIASHSVKDEINAAWFEKYALEKTEEIFKKKNIVIVTGGTGLYIKAFCEGLDTIPETDSGMRNKIREQFRERGLAWLQDEVKAKDPRYFREGEIKNPQRMMRALEVIESTGTSVMEFRSAGKKQRDFSLLKFGLYLPKDELHDRISTRVDQMIEAGLVNEAKGLIVDKNLNALQTVGYKELFEYFDGKTDLTTAIANIKKNTRQYAKRQMTWFRKDKYFDWHDPDNISSIISIIESEMK